MIRYSMKRLCRMITKMTSRMAVTCEIYYMAIIIIINKMMKFLTKSLSYCNPKDNEELPPLPEMPEQKKPII